MLDNQLGEQTNEGGDSLRSSLETPLDAATGYREPDKASVIKVWEKTAFLKDYKSTGNITAAANKLGYKASQFLHALKIDKAFADDFKEAQLDMRHELEGLMFERGLTNNGHKERQAWLEAHFPEDYGKKKPEPKKKSNPVLDNLMKGL